MRPIIRQNPDLPALPDFRNLGVILRVLVAANAAAAIAALVEAPRVDLWPAAFLDNVSILQPQLMLQLALLYAIQPWLERQPYATGAWLGELEGFWQNLGGWTVEVLLALIFILIAALLGFYSAVRFLFAGIANVMGLRKIDQWEKTDWYTLVNARVGFLVANAWTLSVWSRNLLNTNYFELLSAAPGNTGLIVGQPGDPRTAGVTLRFTVK